MDTFDNSSIFTLSSIIACCDTRYCHQITTISIAITIVSINIISVPISIISIANCKPGGKCPRIISFAAKNSTQKGL